MALWTTAKARAATLGPVLVSLKVSSSCWFQASTTLSPLTAWAGWDRPTPATRPRARTSTRPMTVVSLRICRHPSAEPTRSAAMPPHGHRVESWNPGGGKDRERTRWGGSGPAVQPPRHFGPDRRPARPGPDRRRAVTHNPASGGKSPNQARTDTAADDPKAAGVRGQKVAENVSLKSGNGGVAADWFSEMRAIARPARRAGPIVRPPRFRPEWADEGGPSTGDESIGRTPTKRSGAGARAVFARDPAPGAY